METQNPKGFEKVIRVASSMLMYVSTGLLLVMLLLGTADVLGRYLFDHPISGTIEIYEILLPGIVLLSWAHVQREKAHISVDIIYERLPPRFKTIVGLCITILSMVVVAVIIWQGLDTVILNYQMGRMIRNIQIPIYLPELLVPIGAFFFLLTLIVDFFTSIKKITKKE